MEPPGEPGGFYCSSQKRETLSLSVFLRNVFLRNVFPRNVFPQNIPPQPRPSFSL